jgi:hypothetical protein
MEEYTEWKEKTCVRLLILTRFATLAGKMYHSTHSRLLVAHREWNNVGIYTLSRNLAGIISEQ